MMVGEWYLRTAGRPSTLWIETRSVEDEEEQVGQPPANTSSSTHNRRSDGVGACLLLGGPHSSLLS